MGDLAELRAGDLLLLRIGDLVEEMRLLRDVAGAEEQEAIAGQTIAARAAGFLIVAFDVLRQIVVDDPADVGLVDAHAEGDRGADDARVVAEKCLLVARALGGVEAGVVGLGGETAARERFGHALRGCAARAIDDAALRLTLAHELDDLLQRLVLRRDAIGEVGAVEARDEHLRLAQLEVRDDVGAHALGRGGGERHHGHAGQRGPEFGELAIFGSEIMAPLGDAVRLVDRKRGDVPFFQVLVPTLEHEPFGRGVEQAILAAVQAAEPRACLGSVERGIEKRRRHAARLELIDLILHERDQRRDDDREAVAHERGELETKRLATTGGQQREHILAGESRLANLALERAERRIAEGGFERMQEIGHGGLGAKRPIGPVQPL